MANAEVTLTGTAAAPVLNFKIPKGDKGDQGSPQTTQVLPTTEHNLNDWSTTGLFMQSSDSPATLARNYPTTTGGMLKVEASAPNGTFIFQYYHTAGTGLASLNNQQMYMRLRKAGTWSPWKQLTAT